MLKDALEYLTGLARNSVAPVVAAESASNRSYLIDGKIIDVPKPQPGRTHKVDNLEAVIELANRFNGEASPVIWIDEDGVELILNDDDHREDRVTLFFRFSDAFALVKGLALNKPWYEQKPFIRMLRVELSGVLPPAALLEKVRRLQFENGVTTTAEVARNRESMGRQITSKIEAAADIPEAVTLVLPVYKLGKKYPIECAVDTDPARAMLQLMPFPDQIENVVEMALKDIEADLAATLDDGVRVYRGRP